MFYEHAMTGSPATSLLESSNGAHDVFRVWGVALWLDVSSWGLRYPGGLDGLGGLWCLEQNHTEMSVC